MMTWWRVVRLAGVLAGILLGSAATADAAFIRGDTNDDGVVDQADAIYLLQAIYQGGPPPSCWDAADVNDDGNVSLLDPVWILSYLFVAGPPPAAPFPALGSDPTSDTIYCPVPGVTVTLDGTLFATDSDVPVTVFNGSLVSIGVALQQAAAAGGGVTDATFGVGGTSLILPSGATLDTVINTGSLASQTTSSLIAVNVDGNPTAEFAVFDLDVASIAFNHSTSNTNDGVEARRTRLIDILVPEYLNGVRSHEVVYASGNTPTFEIVLEVTPSITGTVELSGLGGGVLGGINPISIALVSGASAPTLVPLSQPTPVVVGKHSIEWQWQASVDGGDTATVDTTSHTVFTILDVPTSPWTPTLAGGTRQPRVDALEVLADFADGATTFQETRTAIVHEGFDLPSFRYDTVSGSPGYGNFIGGGFRFDVDDYINQGYSGTGTVVGCCYDSASIIVCFDNLNGDDMNWLASGSGFVGGFYGYLNCLDPIGTTTPYSNNPFTQSSSVRDDPICAQNGTNANCDRAGFGNHTFGGVGSGSTALIYDLTCTFDVDDNPDTTALWPAGTTASTGLTTTTLTDSGESWLADEFAGFTLRADVHSTFPNPYPEYSIVGNTADTITTTGGSLTSWATSGNLYEIFDHDNPAVEIEYATGWVWPTFQDICVDSTPSTSTPAPITYGFSIQN